MLQRPILSISDITSRLNDGSRQRLGTGWDKERTSLPIVLVQDGLDDLSYVVAGHHRV